MPTYEQIDKFSRALDDCFEKAFRSIEIPWAPYVKIVPLANFLTQYVLRLGALTEKCKDDPEFEVIGTGYDQVDDWDRYSYKAEIYSPDTLVLCNDEGIHYPESAFLSIDTKDVESCNFDRCMEAIVSFAQRAAIGLDKFIFDLVGVAVPYFVEGEPLVEVGFVNGFDRPRFFLQDQNSNGLTLFKCFFEYGGARIPWNCEAVELQNQ